MCNESYRKAAECGKTAKANAGEDCGKAKAVAGSAKRPRVERANAEGGRAWEDGESECWKRLWEGESCRGKRKSGRVRRGLSRAAVFQETAKDEYCRRRPCTEDAKEANAGRSNRVRRRLPQAAVCQKTAGCDCCRKRPCAKGCKEASAVCERLKGLNEVKAGKATACDEIRVPKDCEKARAATGGRVLEDCSRRALLKAAVCENTGERCQK